MSSSARMRLFLFRRADFFVRTGSDYFNTVMKRMQAAYAPGKNAKRHKYCIASKLLRAYLASRSIHNYLLGVTEAEDFHNTIGKVYRMRKGLRQKTAYVAADTRNSIVEPFTFENIDDYERARDNSIKFDPRREYMTVRKMS